MKQSIVRIALVVREYDEALDLLKEINVQNIRYINFSAQVNNALFHTHI